VTQSERVIHGRVRIEVHLPTDGGEETVHGELNFALPVSRAQGPLVEELARVSAKLCSTAVRSLVSSGHLEPMSRAEKIAYARAALSHSAATDDKPN